jgi:hypothetical protein
MSQFLKCDADGCEYIEGVPDITAEMIGLPCPTCGANLLTAEDFEFYSTVLRPGMEMMHALGLSRPATADDPDSLKVRFQGHKGEARIKPMGKTA